MTIVAVVGGGQLARMMAGPATQLGITLRVLVESESAAAAFAAHQTVIGLPQDEAAVAELLAGEVAAVTWEHEHIPASVFVQASDRGIPARPDLAALKFAQDKLLMRQRGSELGLPNPEWAQATDAVGVADFIGRHGPEVIAKTPRGGYDGKGVRVISAAAEVADWLANGPILLEEKIPYTRELAALVARRPSGEVVAWPVVESRQENGVCAQVIAPAPQLDPAVALSAQEIAIRAATALDVTGVLAVELFQVGEQLLVNEFAMRPHNSGHWTIEGAVTSQFEQHLRGVLDWPLGSTAPYAPVAVMANILGGRNQDLTASLATLNVPQAKVHLYGKEVRPGRKLGHVTVTGTEVTATLDTALQVATHIREGE